MICLFVGHDVVWARDYIACNTPEGEKVLVVECGVCWRCGRPQAKARERVE